MIKYPLCTLNKQNAVAAKMGSSDIVFLMDI